MYSAFDKLTYPHQTTGEFSSQKALALEALIEPGEYEREVKAGLGFHRASEDELKERYMYMYTVKICRRGTAFQYVDIPLRGQPKWPFW